MSALRILVEAGKKRTFACALDWPGLARSGVPRTRRSRRFVRAAQVDRGEIEDRTGPV